MRDLVESVIKERREGKGTAEDDLLALMLEASGPETGKGLDDDNVRDQVVTFTVIGGCYELEKGARTRFGSPTKTCPMPAIAVL